MLYSEDILSQIICNFGAYEEWSLILTGREVLNFTSKCFISCFHVLYVYSVEGRKSVSGFELHFSTARCKKGYFSLKSRLN